MTWTRKLCDYKCGRAYANGLQVLSSLLTWLYYRLQLQKADNIIQACSAFYVVRTASVKFGMLAGNIDPNTQNEDWINNFIIIIIIIIIFLHGLGRLTYSGIDALFHVLREVSPFSCQVFCHLIRRCTVQGCASLFMIDEFQVMH